MRQTPRTFPTKSAQRITPMAKANISQLLTPATLKVIESLKPSTSKLVGGCVRDFLLGTISDDIDIATQSLPTDTLKKLEAAGIKAIPTGLAHGTITAICEGQKFEITTLRTDEKTDGRHAEVTFTDDFKTDASRRDFTFNALYLDEAGYISDYFNGEKDLQNGRISFIGDAQERLAEDYLRILRFFRFYARYGQPTPNAKTLKALQDSAPQLKTLSKERITAELVKLIEAPNAQKSWALMEQTDVTHSLQLTQANSLAFKMPPNTPALTILCGLFAHQPITFLTQHQHLNFSKKQAKFIKNVLTLLHDLTPKSHLEALLYQWGVDTLKAALTIQQALTGANAQALEQFAHLKEHTFPLTGADVMTLDITGAQIGETLKKVEDWWLNNNFPDKVACLKQLNMLIKNTQ
jgi:poly(A) polymerase